MIKICRIQARSIQTFARTTHVGCKRYGPNPTLETAWHFTRGYRFMDLKRMASGIPRHLDIVNCRLG